MNYDPSGNRIEKIVKPATTATDPTTWTTTHYVRDAQGNIMSTYEESYPSSTTSFKLMEQPIYGSSRLGLYTPEAADADMLASVDFSIGNRKLSRKQYELTNHLGNVISVVTDKKIPISTDGVNISYYAPDILSAQDYYPDGMLMPVRNYNANDYTFGYQGQLKTDEIAGSGNHYSYKFRESDPRLGGDFWSVDPLFRDYPGWSPYAFGQRRYIDGVELEGLEWKPTKDKEGAVVGFEWAGKEGLDDKGKLKEGYFEKAVLFQGSKNEKLSEGGFLGSKQGGTPATVTVFGKNQENVKTYEGLTTSSDPDKFPQIAEGLYKARQAPFNRKDSPYDKDALTYRLSTLEGSDKLPVVGGLNPATGESFINGAYMHRTNWTGWAGTKIIMKNNKEVTKAVSEGCLLINGIKFKGFEKQLGNSQSIGVLLKK